MLGLSGADCVLSRMISGHSEEATEERVILVTGGNEQRHRQTMPCEGKLMVLKCVVICCSNNVQHN
jgi:hypothetical protein